MVCPIEAAAQIQAGRQVRYVVDATIVQVNSARERLDYLTNVFMRVAYKTWANLFPCSNGSWWCGEGSLCSDETTPYEFLKWPTAKALGFPNGTETVISSSATPVATATGSSVLASLAATSPVSVEAGTSESNCGDKVSKGVPIGVGVGIGVPLLIAVATLAFLWTREKKRNHLPMQPANTVYAHEAEAKPPYLQQPSELDSQSQPHELRS